MTNTHEYSSRLEKIFHTSVNENFSVHCVSDFEGKSLYDAIVFWVGISVGNFITGKNLPLDSSISAKIKNDFWELQEELKQYDGLSWNDIDASGQEKIINSVSDYVKSLHV